MNCLPKGRYLRLTPDLSQSPGWQQRPGISSVSGLAEITLFRLMNRPVNDPFDRDAAYWLQSAPEFIAPGWL